MHKTFAYHKPSPASLAKITKLREGFTELRALIVEVTGGYPLNRESAVALTNLETTAMWAIKAVVSNDPDSEVEL